MLRKVGLSLVAAFALAACALNPVSQAVTVEQKALAAYGSLVIGVEQVAALVKAPSQLSVPVRSCLIAVGEGAGSLAKEGLAAYNEAQAARAQFLADAAAQGRLTAAVNSLDGWLTRAEPLVDRLPSAVRPQGGC